METMTGRSLQVMREFHRLAIDHLSAATVFGLPLLGDLSLVTLRCLCVVFLVLLAPIVTDHLSLKAQTETARISGRVTDPHGGVIPHAIIEAIQEDTNVKTTTETNGDGLYYLASLRPAGYRIVVSKDGFKQVINSGVVLHVQDEVTLNFALEIGSVNETVTVSANAEHLESDNPAVGLLVNRDFVENMPLNGRSFQDLLSLSPGAVTSATGTGLFSINGQREDTNYFTVDGVAAGLNPSPGGDMRGLAGALPAQTALGTTQALVSVDALQEFKIQTSGYSAEFGRQPGGQVELTTRSGSNDLHGSLFDYFRNDALDANSWFFNKEAIPRQAERQNDFGGTLGGPLEIPGIYDGKGKTFYFVSYEGLRLLLPQFSGINDVPTVAFRTFASPEVQPFLNSLPLPNVSGHLQNGDECASVLDPTNPAYLFSCTGEWSAGYSSPQSLDSMNFRVDQIMGEKLQLFLRYSDTPSYVSSRMISQLNSTTTDGHTWTLGATANLSSVLVNDLRFNYSSSSGLFGSEPSNFGGAIPYARTLVVPAQYAPGRTPAIGVVNIFVPNADFFSLPMFQGIATEQHQYNLVDGFSWTKNTHAFKFGVDYRKLSPLFEPAQYEGNFNLLSLAEVQQGFASEVFIAAGQKAHPIFNNLSLYAQDHWKVTPNLTFDYGVRWEFNPAPGASDGLYPLALTTANLATAQLAPSGTPQYHSIYDYFAPRLGLAYSPIKLLDRAVVIRAGAGIFYDTGQELGAEGYGGYPFSVFNALSNIALPVSPATVAPPSLNAPLVPPYGFINGISDPHLKLPYVAQWNISTDFALSARNTFSLSYVGNTGKNLLFQGIELPTNPNFGNGLQLDTNAASSSYNALQIQDQGYIVGGFQVIASYTWAHAMDNDSVDNGFLAPTHGNSDNDLRQVFNLAANYKIGGSNLNGFVRALTSGWSVDNRFFAQTGYPVDVYQGRYFLPDGIIAYFRPNLVPGVPIYLHNVPGVLGGWSLNPAAFSPVAVDPNTGEPLAIGTLGRNFIHGPAFWSLNTAVQRNFQIVDRLALVFRVEAFNIFNHPNPSNIDPLLPDSTFGQPGSVGAFIGVPNQLYATGAPRSLQITLKLQF